MIHIQFALAGILFLIPFLVKKEDGWFGDLLRVMAMFACWPCAVVLLAWGIVEAFRA